MVEYSTQTFKVTACLLQRRVIYDVKEWCVIASSATLLHYAEELLGNTQKQAAPVVGRIGQKTVEAVLSNLSTQQAKPLGLVETEQADFASITVLVNLLCLLYFSEYKYTTNFRETVILSGISEGGKL